MDQQREFVVLRDSVEFALRKGDKLKLSEHGFSLTLLRWLDVSWEVSDLEGNVSLGDARWVTDYSVHIIHDCREFGLYSGDVVAQAEEWVVVARAYMKPMRGSSIFAALPYNWRTQFVEELLECGIIDPVSDPPGLQVSTNENCAPPARRTRKPRLRIVG
jgi:hypothetical protein